MYGCWVSHCALLIKLIIQFIDPVRSLSKHQGVQRTKDRFNIT